MTFMRSTSVTASFAIGMVVVLAAQSGAPVRAGVVEHIKVHGKSLEGNLEGDSPIVMSPSTCLPATVPSARAAIRSSTCCMGMAEPTRTGRDGKPTSRRAPTSSSRRNHFAR